MSKAIAASSALSPLFRPEEIGGKILQDGGIVANLPIDAARRMGADIVIAVSADTSLPNIKPEAMKHLGNITGRIADIYCFAHDEWAMRKADVTIWANEDAVPLTTRNKKKIRYAIAQGEVTARKALPYIRKLLDEEKTATVPMAPSI